MITKTAKCEDCKGAIEYHDDDHENPWKHRIPEEAFGCAQNRPQHEVVPINQTVINVFTGSRSWPRKRGVTPPP